MNNESDVQWGESDPNPPVKTEIGHAYHSDRLFYRVVVFTLAIVAVGALAGSIYLASADEKIPQSIVALGSTAVGALAGVLITGKG